MMETCLAMTIFREEFNTRFVALFVMLLLVKMGHWLSHDRVAYVETTPALSYRAHVRILTFLVLLLLLDAAALQYAVSFLPSLAGCMRMMSCAGVSYACATSALSLTLGVQQRRFAVTDGCSTALLCSLSATQLMTMISACATRCECLPSWCFARLSAQRVSGAAKCTYG